MIDTSRAGMRCRARRIIRTQAVVIEAASQGTIVHELENLGRRLILVQWDSGPLLLAFSDEVDIAGELDPA